MRPQPLAGGSRNRLQKREPAHVVTQVAQSDPSGSASSSNAPHSRPLHLVDHAAEHVFDDMHADLEAQAVNLFLMRRQGAAAMATYFQLRF